MSKETPDVEKVSPDEVRAYLRTRASQKAGKKKLAEVHGQTKVEFVEGTGFNKTAVAFMEKLDGLSPEVRSDVLRSIDIMRLAMDGVWGQQPDMFDPKNKTAEEKAESMAKARASARRSKASKRVEKDADEPTKPPVHYHGHPDEIGSDQGPAPEPVALGGPATREPEGGWDIPDDEPDPDNAFLGDPDDETEAA